MIKYFTTVELMEETKTVTEGIKNTIFKIILTVANDWNIIAEVSYDNRLDFHQKDRKAISFSLLFQFRIWE